jgi:hypothetical protein
MSMRKETRLIVAGLAYLRGADAPKSAKLQGGWPFVNGFFVTWYIVAGQAAHFPI